ncbi:MAG: hypothetical protein J2P48_15180, partial [Alphaproteobacteria bacterium]|nr:hypothetical protein [Alphaproteobacteria bacterium]
AALDRNFGGPDDPSDRPLAGRASRQPEWSANRMSSLHWPCVLPSISVAVVPLKNLTGDPEQQYLTEAFTEDLIADLLRHSHAFSLKLLNERAQSGSGASAAKRGFDYIVTGSFQRSTSGTLRVNMRIAHAATSEYLWAGRHEFKPEDLVPIQTRITRRISRELHGLLLQNASRRAFIASGMNRDVAGSLTEAAAALKGKVTPELTAEAQRWYLAALAQHPRSVEALTGLALTCQQLIGNPWWADPYVAAAASDLGRAAVAIALDLAPGHAVAKCIQGMLCSAAGQLELAGRAFDQALALDQGLAPAHGFAGYNAALLGRASETMPAVERAMRLDQADRRHSIWFFFGGFAEMLLGRIESSIGLLRRSLELNPSYGGAQLFLMGALSLVGRRGAAAETAASFRSRYPDYRIATFEQLWLSRSNSSVYRAQVRPLFEKVCALGVAS